MKQQAIQQEILLVLGTRFSAREFAEKDGADTQPLTEKEMLERACWNGLLPEMLPEIFEGTEGNEELLLWRIKTTSHILELDMGLFPEFADSFFSIDPYSFLANESFS